MKAIHHLNGDPNDNRPNNLAVVDTTDAPTVRVVPVGDYWRVSWSVPSSEGRASWDFRSEEQARKAAAIIAAWKPAP